MRFLWPCLASVARRPIRPLQPWARLASTPARTTIFPLRFFEYPDLHLRFACRQHWELRRVESQPLRRRLRTRWFYQRTASAECIPFATLRRGKCTLCHTYCRLTVCNRSSKLYENIENKPSPSTWCRLTTPYSVLWRWAQLKKKTATNYYSLPILTAILILMNWELRWGWRVGVGATNVRMWCGEVQSPLAMAETNAHYATNRSTIG